MTISEAAKKWKLPQDMVRFWARSGRIPGATQNQHGRWQVPDHVVAAGRPHPGGPDQSHRNAHQDHLDAQVIGRSK